MSIFKADPKPFLEEM